MRLLATMVDSLLLLAVSAFCMFGSLATFEQTNNHFLFRVGYTVVGVGCLAGAGIQIVNAVRK
jgi:hypothetical protein